MYILILLIMAKQGVSPSVTSIGFENEPNCLQAMSKVIEFESKTNLIVKARCVKK
jgi:hypothetical protein